MVVGYQIGERGANYRDWLKIVQTTDAQGNTILTTNLAYVQLATGLNYKDPATGKWLPAKEEIDGYPGGAIAQYGQHKVIFANNLNTAGAIDLQTPDGKELRSDVLGLSYYDTASGKSVLIATVQDSQGQIVSSNEVLYPDAFKGVKASVLYKYTLAGLEQDVILSAQPPSPENFGLSSASSVLQVLTEFTAAPTPTIRVLGNGTATNGVLTDEWLSFGDMKMMPGRAFLFGTNSPSTRVCKQWLNINGRMVLVESVPVPLVKNALSHLPTVGRINLKPKAGSVQCLVSNQQLLPPKRDTKGTRAQMEIAKSSKPEQGFVLDYPILNGTQPPNYTFQGDTTYEISGTVVLSGTTIFEPGTVLKYAPGTEISFSFSSTPDIQCQGTPYRPIIFTARDDDSVGQPVNDSLHTISGSYATCVLSMGGPNLSSASYFRILHASNGMFFYGGTPTISDAQFVDCQTAFKFQFCPINVYNTLFSGVSTIFYNNINFSQESYSIQNVTFDNVGCIFDNAAGGSWPALQVGIANSILANITQVTSGGNISLGGNNNGFYNCTTTFGGSQFSSTDNPFQEAGGGNYYLNNDPNGGEKFQGVGTTSINSSLLNSLQNKTTRPPVVYDGTTIPSDNFGTRVPRDSENPGPDLGYHYPPLDYVFQNCQVNSSMTFPAGTAVGWQSQGLTFSASYSVTFNGTVDNPCYFVRCNTVQESDQSGDGTGMAGSGQWPTINATFTRFSALADVAKFFDANALNVYPYNCEFWSGLLGGSVNNVNGGLDLECYNCLFDRCFIDIAPTASSAFCFLYLQNCTLHGGTLTVDNLNDDT